MTFGLSNDAVWRLDSYGPQLLKLQLTSGLQLTGRMAEGGEPCRAIAAIVYMKTAENHPLLKGVLWFVKTRRFYSNSVSLFSETPCVLSTPDRPLPQLHCESSHLQEVPFQVSKIPNGVKTILKSRCFLNTWSKTVSSISFVIV